MAYIKLNDLDIYYEVHGKGEALFILNGIMMSTNSWHMFLPELKDYKVILLDFFDQGKSSNMDKAYTHEIQIECIEAVRKHLGLDKVNIVGVSYGAQVALQYTLKYPKHVKRQIIFNAASYTNSWLMDIGKAWQLAARSKNASLFYHVAIPYIYSPNFYNNNIAWMNERKETLKNFFDLTFFSRIDRLIESSVTYDIRKALIDVLTPTLVVSASNDYITPVNEGSQIHELIKKSHFIVLNDCGHASMYEKVTDFLVIIKGFVNQSDFKVKI